MSKTGITVQITVIGNSRQYTNNATVSVTIGLVSHYLLYVFRFVLVDSHVSIPKYKKKVHFNMFVL